MTQQIMQIDRHGLKFIEDWECYVGYVYDDKVPARTIKGKRVYKEYLGGPIRGTLTIGIGHTKVAKAVVDMAIGAHMTHEEALRVLNIDLDPCENAVNKLVRVPLTQGQFNALVSFVYNCGEGAFRKSSILRKLNAGNYTGARASFDLYVMSKGERMNGLQRRRDAEQVMWDSRADLHRFMPAAGEDVDHPAEVDDPQTKSIVKSTEGITSAGQVVGGAAGDVKEGFDAYATVDKAIEAKNKAEELGVQPLDWAERIWGMAGHLVHSPLFWVCTVAVGTGLYLFFRRRWRLKEEI